MNLKFKETKRGFARVEFIDRYGEKCSLQKSSLAGEDAVWFGTEGRVSFFRGNQAENGAWQEPWVDMELPDGALVHSRMHLTQDQVRDLLPYLQHFAETGELPEEGDKAITTIFNGG